MLIICDKIHLITFFFAFLNILPHGLWGTFFSPQFLPGNKKALFSRLSVLVPCTSSPAPPAPHGTGQWKVLVPSQGPPTSNNMSAPAGPSGTQDLQALQELRTSRPAGPSCPAGPSGPGVLHVLQVLQELRTCRSFRSWSPAGPEPGSCRS